MITKGLDFNKVSLVGILNADNILNFPDFRSHERAFQLLSQVSGRAGRKDKQGKVILQTYQPKHPIIQQVIAQRLRRNVCKPVRRAQTVQISTLYTTDFTYSSSSRQTDTSGSFSSTDQLASERFWPQGTGSQ